ncbi:MAG: hypothetical protein Q7U80_03065 [Thiobacillus sp.]|nr:hypothetical protein [Thiobacillus sp.]
MLKRTVITLATLTLLPLQSMAALQCATGLTHVNVNGSVTTLNVSETKQVGQICVSMIRTADGREVFDDCGAVVGKILSIDEPNQSSVLSHTALFSLRNLFVTHNDQAQITGVLAADDTGAPCAFSVVETISEIEKGTGVFRGGQIAVTATGSISFCPGKNLNTFALQGEACVRK